MPSRFVLFWPESGRNKTWKFRTECAWLLGQLVKFCDLLLASDTSAARKVGFSILTKAKHRKCLRNGHEEPTGSVVYHVNEAHGTN